MRPSLLAVGLALVPALAGGLLAPPPAAAEEPAPQPFVVVVHPNQPLAEVSRAKLADLFLRKVNAWDSGSACKPVDQAADTAARKAFSDGVLKRSVAAVVAYWQQRVFSGRGAPPPQVAGDDEVATYVKANEGAVGYLSPKASLTGLKVLRVLP
ncbi:MAG: substrate-binding domain-containing protein [Myxococcales bacterium]